MKTVKCLSLLAGAALCCVILCVWYDTAFLIGRIVASEANHKVAGFKWTTSRHGRGTQLQCPDEFALDEASVRDFAKAPQRSNYTTRGLDDVRERESVLILTPVSTSAKYLHRYFSLLCTLSYPHTLISIALGEDSSNDKTFKVAQIEAKKLASHDSFHFVKIFHLKRRIRGRSFYSRHDRDFQLTRRRHLAHARNELLFRSLADHHDWVLWIDVDVTYYSPDLIQHLLSARNDVAAPSCLYMMPNGVTSVYDRNTWQETPQSLAYLASKPKDFLMLEGYDPTKRKYLTHLQDQGDVVPLDGVGGCTLLVRGACHRAGLIFPSFVFEQHIETEGLGKMAKNMGFSVVGLPHVRVFHD